MLWETSFQWRNRGGFKIKDETIFSRLQGESCNRLPEKEVKSPSLEILKNWAEETSVRRTEALSLFWGTQNDKRFCDALMTWPGGEKTEGKQENFFGYGKQLSLLSVGKQVMGA